jgi:putative peptidoglycan lipid II flippase
MAGLAPVSIAVQACSFASSIALARVLGASVHTDAYYLGLSVPALTYGVLLAALRLGAIPALTETEAEGGRGAFGARAGELVSAVLVGSACLAVVVTALTEAVLPLVLGGDARLVSLTRVTVLELAPLGVLGALTGALSAVLAVRRVFALPIAIMALEPILKTVLTLTLGHRLGIQALILGNIVGSASAAAVLLVRARREGLELRLTPSLNTPFVRDVARVSVPLLVSQSVLQVNPVVDRAMASQLGSGSVTSLELGLRLFFVPSTLLLGALVGPITATWAARRASGGWPALQQSVDRAIAGALAVVPPIVVLGVLLRRPAVSFVYSGGAYSTHALHETAAVFGTILLGLPAQLLVVILATLFIVQSDTVLPMKIGLANVVLNVALNFALRPVFGAAGIALSTTLTFTLLVVVYALCAHRRWGRLYGDGIVRGVATAGLSTVAVGAVAAGLLAVLPDASTRPRALLVLAAVGLSGFAVHALVLVARGDLSRTRTPTWLRRDATRATA